jgi:hypothetical protein
MNSKKLAWLITAALATPLAANAASVTYDFTGTVTTSSGIYAQTVGTTVSGTYTINLGDATSTFGTVGSQTSNWKAESTGTNAYVFSDSVSGGTFFYNTPSTAGTFSSASFVENIVSTPTEYDAYEGQFTASGTGVESSFTVNNNGGATAYGTNGLPLTFNSPVGGSSDSGYVNDFSGGTKIGSLTYSITSLTLPSTVPLPAAAWLMFSGLAGLVFVVRRRKVGTGFATTA